MNLVVLGGPNDLASAYRRGVVGGDEFLPPVLAVVIAGLVTPELILRWFKPLVLVEKFSYHYSSMVFTACFSGILMGFLLATALTLNKALVLGPTSLLDQILVSLQYQAS